MSTLALLYESQKQDISVAEAFILRRMAAIKAGMSEVDREIVERMMILGQQRRSHSEHLDMVERYKNEALLRNSEGIDHVEMFNRILSDLKGREQEIYVSAWRDTASLRRERREMLKEYWKELGKKLVLDRN